MESGQVVARTEEGRAEEPGPTARPRAALILTLRRRFAGEWLLIRVTRERASRPAAGVLLAHHGDRKAVLAAAVRERALDDAAPLYLTRADVAPEAFVITVWLGGIAVDVLPDLTSAETRLSPDALWLAQVAEVRALRRSGRRVRVPELRLGGSIGREVEVLVEPPLSTGVEGTLGTAALTALGAMLDLAARRVTFRRHRAPKRTP